MSCLRTVVRGGLFAVLFVVPALVARADIPVALANPAFEETENGQPKGWRCPPGWKAERCGHNGSGGLAWEFAASADGRPCQPVTLRPGRRYVYSALFRTDGVTTERPTKHQGLSIRLQGRDAKGKPVWSASTRDFVSGTGDWRKSGGISSVVPETVATAEIQLWARDCTGGRAWIDNVYLAEVETRPVEAVHSAAYRNESAGGEVRFMAPLNLDPAEDPANYAATFSWDAAKGVSVRAEIAESAAIASLDTTRFAVGTNRVVCTLTCRGRVCGSAELPFVRLERPVRRKVGFDRRQRTLVDGKPFFPLGMYFRGVDEKTLDLFADGPFNCILPYKPAGRQDLDLCARRGYKVVYDLREWYDEADGGEAKVRARVGELKDHPALLAWYTNDERPLGLVPRLIARQRLVAALDPDHPCYSVQDVANEARQYLASYDVLGVDCYPVPKSPVGEVAKRMRTSGRGTMGLRPRWDVPQAFAWGWLFRAATRGQRAPTRDEMANMSWQMVACGANGLFYYAFQHIYERHPVEDPDESYAAFWPRVKSAAGEIKKYEDVLLSDETPPEVTGGTSDALVARAWRRKGETYLVVVNCRDVRQEAAVGLSESFGRVVASDFGPAPVLQGGSEVRCELPPLGYVMVRLK